MVFTSARLQNYRSYNDGSFEFEPGVNIVVGPNASGKTNLLDALHFAAVGAPVRQGKEFFINTNQSWARVDVLTDGNQERIVRIKGQERPDFEIDGKKYKRLSLETIVPVVLFEPNHLYQITTSPEQRRLFIDNILSKTDPEFRTLKNAYVRVLQQRNSLLKQNIAEVKKQIFAWDVRLSELAGSYVEKRLQLISKINLQSEKIYSAIAGNQHSLSLAYESKMSTTDYASSLLKMLQIKLDLDNMRGFTGYGPHRDDISILIDRHDMRNVASRGETRSILLALKVVEARLLEDVYGQKPLLLFDDVFGELDGSRRKSLIEFMSGSQTFITTTDADIIGHTFAMSANVIPLAARGY